MGVRRLSRGLRAALLCLALLAGLAPDAAAQSGKLCTSPTPVPERTPPLDLDDFITFAFAQDSYTAYTSGAGTASIAVTRTGTRAASVDYETEDGSLTAPGGYTHTAGTLRFAAGETSKSFTVPVSGVWGKFDVFLSNASDGGAVCAGSARPWGSEVLVRPLQPPGLSLSRSSLNVAENGSATYAVRLDSWPIGGDVTVTITGMSGTDVTVDTDSGMSGDQDTLTFTATDWNRPRTVTLRAGGDTDATDDSVTLTHTASGANYGSVAGSLFVTVIDDYSGTPLIDFTQTHIGTFEGGTAVIRVRKIGSGAASVDYATSDGSNVSVSRNAVSGTHYTAASGTLTFAAGDTEKTFTVAILDDGVVDVDRDRDRSFTVTLSNPSGAALGSQSGATVTIRQPRFEFTSANYHVREDQGPAVVTVRKIGPGPGGVEWLTIAEGWPFAEPPGDRPILEDQVLEFAAGETEKTFTVPIVDDGVPEHDEQFGVALRIPPHRGELGKNRAFVTIENWPPPPVIRFKGQESDLHETDVQENAGTATLTVVKTGGATSETVTVDYSIPVPDHPGPGLALPPGDYTDVSGTLSFGPSETEKTITVPIIDDDTDEPREYFWVWLRNPSGAVFDLEFLVVNELVLQQVNLIDDDPAPVVGFASSAQTVYEGDGTVTLTVTKTGATARLVRVDYATADATATAPGDYTETSGTLEFGPSETEKTITVPLASDGTTEDPETFSVALSNPWRATLGRSLTYLLLEDGDAPTGMQVEAAPPAMTISTDATSVTEGGDVTFTFTADPAPASDLTVNVAVDEEMGDGHDLVASTQIATVTVPAGETSATWTVTAMSDEVERADGTVAGRVLPSDGGEYTVGEPSEVTLALLDDDGAPVDGTQGGTPENETPGSANPAVDPDLVAQVRELAGQTRHGTAHVTRWRRVLVAFGVESYPGLTPMTAAEAKENAEKYSSPLWPKIAKILAALEGEGEEEQEENPETDPDPPPVVVPAVSVAAGDGVAEGGNAAFTFTANPAPSADLAVSVSVAVEGEYGVTAGSRTVTIDSAGNGVLTLATADDETDESDGSVSVTVEAGDGYMVGSPGSGTVAVRDDDEPPPEVSIAATSAAVAEGADAAFTVTASRASDADLTVRLAVSEAAGSDHVAAANEGAATVTIAQGDTEAAFGVATVDDGADEPDGSVTVSVSAGDGYTVASSPGGAATVTVSDNDAAALPVLSVDDATVEEGNLMMFTVRLSAPAAGAVEVVADTRESDPVSAESKQDYWPLEAREVLFRAGETQKQVPVVVYDDSHDEDPETFELVLSQAEGAEIGDGVAVGAIVNDDPMPAAFLARLGRTVAEQALDGIAGRLAAPREPGTRGTLAGRSLSFGAPSGENAEPGRAPGGHARGATAPAGTGALALTGVAQAFGGHSGAFGHANAGFGHGNGFGPGPGSLSGAGYAQPHPMTARDALLGSSFSLTGLTDAQGGSVAFWGRTAQGSFKGREGAHALSGEAVTATLGVDYARGQWLAGVALAQSAGEGEYRDTEAESPTCPDGVYGALCGGAVRAGDGSVNASLTAAIPYAALEVSERLKLWGAAGYGTGKVRLKTELGASYTADTRWSLAAAGLRGDVLAPPAEGGGFALAVISDALWTQTLSEKTRDLAASDAGSTRVRLGLEGSYRLALEGGGQLAPKIELGARHDGGGAETGFGVEIGGGVVWSDPRLGLSLDVSGRTLLTHGNEDLKDQGFAVALGFDPDPETMRGLSIDLRQEFGGQAQGGLDALFRPATLEERIASEAASRWSLEVAYGLPAFGGRFTGSPHAELGVAAGTRDYSVGWRMTPEAEHTFDLSFALKATRRESAAAAPEHAVVFESRGRF